MGLSESIDLFIDFKDQFLKEFFVFRKRGMGFNKIKTLTDGL